MKETITTYLEGLLNNKLVSWDGTGVYVKHERRQIFKITLGVDALSVFQQERMRPSEWYMKEMPYNQETFNSLRSLLGA